MKASDQARNAEGEGLHQAADLVVVGAGPGGSRAAELLARCGLRVVLLDPRAPWEKPCGGGLSAATLRRVPALRELGRGIAMVRELVVTAPCGLTAVVKLRSPWGVVSRAALAEWGLDRARAAGVRFAATAADVVCRDGARGWLVETTAGDTITARWLVAADGAASRMRATLSPRLRPRLDPARMARTIDGVERGRAVFRFLAGAPAYLWDFPRPDHHSVGAVGPPGRNSRKRLDQAIEAYRAGALPGETPMLQGAVIGTSAWVSGGYQDMAGTDWVLLGDAAGLADPASGEGIGYALRSAAVAAAAFDHRSGFTAYPALARQTFAAERRRALAVERWLYRPGVIDSLLRASRQSARMALLLTAIADAMNEHRSITVAALRALARLSVSASHPAPRAA